MTVSCPLHFSCTLAQLLLESDCGDFQSQMKAHSVIKEPSCILCSPGQLSATTSAMSHGVKLPVLQKLKPTCGEQLVYVAALGVSADIVYGDRPKHDTYRRLWEATSLAELDYAFGLQVRVLCLQG